MAIEGRPPGAARTLVAERGPTGFRLAKTAKPAGVAPAAPCRHFNDCNALLAELTRRGFTGFVEKALRD
jgi:hypothetical protein